MKSISLQHRVMSNKAVVRLTQLCEFFEEMPADLAKKFKMTDYFSQEGSVYSGNAIAAKRALLNKYKPSSWNASEIPAHEILGPVCTTRACALGWAASLPVFKGQGLEMTIPTFDAGSDFYVISMGSPIFRVDGARVGPHDAAMKFFDIPTKLADALFGPVVPNFGPNMKYLKETPQAWARECRYIIQIDGGRYYDRA